MNFKIELATLLIRVVCLGIVGFALPALRKWISTKIENEKLVQVQAWARQAVRAAEQLHNKAKKDDPTGEIRRKFARELIIVACKRIGVVLTEEDIRILIEAAVHEINAAGTWLIEEEEEKEG